MTEGTGSPTGRTRIEWIDALRGWAILGVVLVHSGPTARCGGVIGNICSAGQYGVQLFFIVSALTISLTYESHIVRYGRSVRSDFGWLIKRFFRIVPLYYLAIILYRIEEYACVHVRHSVCHSTGSVFDVIANFLFVNTWISSANNSIVPGGWSIGVEMFFYLLTPLIWLVVPMRRRIILLAVGAALCLSGTVLVSAHYDGTFYVHNNAYLYFWFPTQAPVLALGLIFYFLRGCSLAAPRGLARFFAFFGTGLCLALGLYCGTGAERMPILSPSLLGASFIFLLLTMGGAINRVIVNRYVTFLGKISYSVYIFHFAVLDLVRAFFQLSHFNHFSSVILFPVFFFALLAASGIGWLSKRWIEDPFIAFGHRLSDSVSRGKGVLAVAGSR